MTTISTMLLSYFVGCVLSYRILNETEMSKMLDDKISREFNIITPLFFKRVLVLLSWAVPYIWLWVEIEYLYKRALVNYTIWKVKRILRKYKNKE